jgi:putative tryptophan/tyrosine transport system substrate-binding protein
MKRREFIALIGSAAALGLPLAARAEQSGNRLPTIGFLGTEAVAFRPRTTAFVKRLGELGWIEGRTVAIAYRWSEGHPERIAEIAAEFVRLNVDVIVANGSAVPALKRASSTIPIVFGLAIDPLGAGLVTSLAHPGGNVTGMSNQQSETAGKRLELARTIIPGLHRLAIIADIGFTDPVLDMGQSETAARSLGLEVTRKEIRQVEDIAPALAALKGQADALYVVQDALITANLARIIAPALDTRLPTIFSSGDYVHAGGLMSYGANFADLYRRTAELVDKILRGAKPDDIPVEQPTKFDLVINLKTAKTLGITVPPTLLALADEVIE